MLPNPTALLTLAFLQFCLAARPYNCSPKLGDLNCKTSPGKYIVYEPTLEVDGYWHDKAANVDCFTNVDSGHTSHCLLALKNILDHPTVPRNGAGTEEECLKPKVGLVKTGHPDYPEYLQGIQLEGKHDDCAVTITQLGHDSPCIPKKEIEDAFNRIVNACGSTDHGRLAGATSGKGFSMMKVGRLHEEDMDTTGHKESHLTTHTGPGKESYRASYKSQKGTGLVNAKSGLSPSSDNSHGDSSSHSDGSELQDLDLLSDIRERFPALFEGRTA
ncbi:hypothetical protein BJ508DRAFT_300712 [Ascobolus immersus RN42]|uniref:Ecp2 effector protein domain-containing protein n=1 Tax=Ascobolus immersus RN42 TaxID=1160509 RepID=A0A3N4IT61_ASCIM|nr:hypothetical protein BJ508DRAFT_300712 [Ascobolus immersus RN42]